MNRPIDRLRSQLASTTRRSGFAMWLAQENNFAEFEATRRETGIRWRAVAAWARAEGMASAKTDDDGKQKGFTAAAAKRAYEREKTRRMASGQEAAAQAPRPALAPAVTVLEVQPRPSHPSVRILPQPEPEKPAGSRTAEEFLESMKPSYLRKKPERQPDTSPRPVDDIADQLDAGKYLPKRQKSTF